MPESGVDSNRLEFEGASHVDQLSWQHSDAHVKTDVLVPAYYARPLNNTKHIYPHDSLCALPMMLMCFVGKSNGFTRQRQPQP